MNKIPLTQGKFAIVDNEDHKWLKQNKWFYTKVGYGARDIWFNGKKSRIYMHREILGITNSEFLTDHINLDTLDNRKINLRIANKSQNSQNRGLRKDNTLGYKGIRYMKKRKKSWTAKIQINGKSIFLGYYTTIESAALAYNEAAKKYFGEFARINNL